MGLLSGVASLLHLNIDSEKKAQIRSEIDLSEAVQAHIQWKLRLQNCLDGKTDEHLDPMVICRDDQCKLGQWIHGPGMNHFHDLEPFHQLRADHAQFHYVAANVVRNVQGNDPGAAKTIMEGEYPRISHKVVVALTELHKAVND
jgi:Chemoreceptor zinc-binding domain